MTNEAKAPSADPIDHPVIRIGNKEHTIKISCGTLIRLNKLGVDLFEQPPFDKHANNYSLILAEIAELSKAETPDEEKLATRRAEAAAEHAQISSDRLAWQPPLSRGSLLEQLDRSITVIATSLKLDPEQVADDIEPHRIREVFQVLELAAKKALAQIATQAK